MLALLERIFGLGHPEHEPDYTVMRPEKTPAVRMLKVDVGRTERYDNLPWSYWCRTCRRWGHGYATKGGAQMGSRQHDCNKLQYNEEVE